MITPVNYQKRMMDNDVALNYRYPISYQRLDLTTGGVVTYLTVPAGANSAIITAIVTSGTPPASGIAFRYLEEPLTTLTTSAGMPLGNGDTYEISGPESLSGFRICAATTYTTAEINITYYH